MSLSRIPLPSIALVLTSDHAALPSRPSVIKVEFDPLQTIYPTSSGSRVSDPVDPQIDPTGVQHDNQPIVDERFFFSAVNDSSTNVGHSDNGQLDDESDAQTTLAEGRPSTSHGSASKGFVNGDITLKGNVLAFANTIRGLLFQFKFKSSQMNKSAQITAHVIDE
ncbi:hypothetical protein M413DRAFT_447470 [Hebeloma cylindrosporum]|uniref:Uncharacterized protein n=1 Tax=Hebeloma cylindrosporum TaxID=76867 RepID=A0A0C3C6D2_HEBCY|nr:hypothetical protein M413DRAFT_447470 [Hebeloma cylindrosporum h7]